MFFQYERIEKIVRELNGYIYYNAIPIKNVSMKEGDFKSPEAAEKDYNDWTTFNYDDRWGGKDERCWFEANFVIPEAFKNKTVVFQIKTGREGEWDAINPQFLVYLNGQIVQGLDVNHREIIISQNAKAGDKYTVSLHAYSGMKEGSVEFKAQISILDKLTEKVYYDIKVPLETAQLLDKEDKRCIDILSFLSEAINMIDFRKPYSEDYYLSLKKAEDYLKENFYEGFCGKENVTAACVGHTHIDVAWLWTLRQTREKVARSFSTVLSLMEQYPEYKFMASQPQLYKFLKEEHPDLYEKVKERHREGRWEAEGAMWLEADCNLVSGESLIRQILFGKRFFKEEFGVDSKILWLPDVFGYSAALPQILKKFNIDYFLTTKISWNEYNSLPYDTFMWEGIDGSSILSYFITTADYEKVLANSHRTIYEGFINPSQVMGAWRRFQQKNLSDEVLISFGYGDGGGGPTKEMLENARRMEKGIPGCPAVKMSTAKDFFEKLEQKVINNNKLPRWVGELYLEYHRGTYTSMGKNKRFNRKCEFLFQDVELFNMLNSCIDKKYVYPQKEINISWETLLLNQFHDIIPGSSIKEVYNDSEKQYEIIIKTGDELLNRAVDTLLNNIHLTEKSLVVFNQLSFKRDDVVVFDLPKGTANIELVDKIGTVYPVQLIDNNKGMTFVKNLPSKGYKSFAIRECTQPTSYIEASCEKLCNKYFDITLDEKGNISSIYDKESSREVLKKGERANVLQAFEDKPHNYDAWDINIYYQEKMWEVDELQELKIISNGPVATIVKITKKFLDSTITQYMYIYNDMPRIDFYNEVDWKEHHILLKAAFPVDIHTSKAVYEIQYGNIERPTHWNTSWDLAKFEVCAHKWADLSEDNYGVSLLNDCKYGHDIKDSVMRLTLIKSPTWPNPDADKGLHIFAYSLYPHKGDWKTAGTAQKAYEFNCPMYTKIQASHKGMLPDELSFIKVDQPNVFIEVVKKAEDSDEIVIRLYEAYNRRCKVFVQFFKNLEFVAETNLNEESIDILIPEENSFNFEIKPYEIRTFKVKLKD